MKFRGTRISPLSRRQFLIGTAAFITSLPLRAIEKPTTNAITVDIHSHASLNAIEMDGFLSSTGPDVSFISGHELLGPLPSVFREIEERKIQIARTPEDIIRAKSQGRRVAMISNEGGYNLNGDLSKLEEMNAKGLVSLQLVREISYGVVDNDHNLTSFGKDLIRAQNRLGMIVDLAHAHGPTIEHAAEVSTRPIMLSHNTSRGKSVWKVVAQTGGIIGCWWGPKEAKNGFTFDQWINRFAIMADSVGVDALGVQTELGTDVHRGPFDHYANWSLIGQALLKKGFNQRETDKILGGNFMRMFTKITAGIG